MCALLLVAYALALALPFVREFFELAAPSVEIVATAVAGAAIALAGLELMGLRQEEGLLEVPDGAAQLQVGDHSRHGRQPEGDRTVGEHRDHGEAAGHPEADQRRDHAALRRRPRRRVVSRFPSIPVK